MNPDQTRLARMLLFLLGIFIAGCVQLEPAATPNSDRGSKAAFFASRSNEVAALLSYYQRIRALPAENLAAEYALATQTLAKQRSDIQRLKLALLFALPNAPFRDDGRSVALAEETISNKANENAELKLFAQHIVAVAGEQKRQEERYQQIVQKLKEEEKRAETLQQKLDALKTIEKDLINREQTKPLKVK